MQVEESRVMIHSDSFSQMRSTADRLQMIQSQDGEKDFSLQEGLFQNVGDVSDLHLLIKKAQSGKTDKRAFPAGSAAADFRRFQLQGELELFGFLFSARCTAQNSRKAIPVGAPRKPSNAVFQRG